MRYLKSVGRPLRALARNLLALLVESEMVTLDEMIALRRVRGARPSPEGSAHASGAS